jgi:PKD repeat protein
MKSQFTFSILLFCTFYVQAQTVGSGNALNFTNTNQYVNIPQNWPIDSFPFTIMAWIKADVPTAASAPIVSSNNSTLGYSGFNVQLVNNGGWNLELMLGTGGTGFVSGTRRSKLVAFNHFNRWCHIAIVVNGMGNYDMYINGVLQSGSYSGAGNTFSFNPPGLPRIGYFYASTTNQPTFRGDIDEVSIWAVALSQTQIRNRMCKNIPITAPGLVSYYEFDETTGTATTDSGPSNKNGTLSSASLRQVSGAPIGTEVAYFYPSTSNPVMKLVNISGDTIKVTNVTGTNQGMHIYTVNSPPNTQNGIVTTCPSNRYYGVFPVISGTNTVNYQVQLRRPNYLNAVSFNRADNAGNLWSASTITQTTNGFNWNTTNRNEFITSTGPSAEYTTTISGALVQFTNSSTSSSPMTFSWNFGDGSTSAIQSPTHIYTTPGNYWACLTVTDSCGSQTYCDSVTTSCSGTAAFAYQQTATRTISFFNQSTGLGGLQYLWNFGNGTTSAAANPLATYTTEGMYWVCLQTTDTCGTFTYCDSVEVTCYNLNADYTFTQNNLTASFTNLSTGTAGMSNYWTFGDGGFSFTKNPVYTYQNEGTYQVCLQVTDSCSTRTTCYNLSMCLLPSSNFVANNTTGFTFNFIPTTANALSYIWDFGDGNFSAASSPTYTYQNPGLYNVCMSLVDDCGDADTCIDVLASLFDLNEFENSNAITVFPNPTKNYLHIKGLPETGVYAYDLMNAVGQTIQRGKLEDDIPIALKNLPEGLYILYITNAVGNRWDVKVIVE